MNKILFALIFLVVGFLLAYLIHIITMKYDKVSENTKLNKDMVVGALIGMSAGSVTDPSSNKPLTNFDGTILGKCAFDELRSDYSEEQIKNFVYDFMKLPRVLSDEDKKVMSSFSDVLTKCATKHKYS